MICIWFICGTNYLHTAFSIHSRENRTTFTARNYPPPPPPTTLPLKSKNPPPPPRTAYVLFSYLFHSPYNVFWFLKVLIREQLFQIPNTYKKGGSNVFEISVIRLSEGQGIFGREKIPKGTSFYSFILKEKRPGSVQASTLYTQDKIVPAVAC